MGTINEIHTVVTYTDTRGKEKSSAKETIITRINTTLLMECGLTNLQSWITGNIY